MGRQLVKILGIEHHYLNEDWFRASRGILSSDDIMYSEIRHKGELALYMPNFVYDAAINAPCEREISFGDQKFVAFDEPSIDDHILIKLDINSYFDRSPVECSPKYKGILAKDTEFEVISLRDITHCSRSSFLGLNEEAAIYLSEENFTETSLLELIGYKRTPFSNEEIEAHKESLQRFQSHSRPGGLRTLSSENSKSPFPGPIYKELIRFSK